MIPFRDFFRMAGSTILGAQEAFIVKLIKNIIQYPGNNIEGIYFVMDIGVIFQYSPFNRGNISPFYILGIV